MKVYTYSEAERDLSAAMNVAQKDGEVRISLGDGRVFALSPVAPEKSPLDVEGVDVDMTTDEIVELIRELRGGPIPDKCDEPAAE